MTQQPLIADIERMWRELDLIQDVDIPSAVQHLISHFRETRANGGVQYALFHYTPHPVLTWFARTCQLVLPHFDLATGFVSQLVVQRALPALQIPTDLPEPLAVEQLDTFELEASLLREIVGGGAYHKFTGTRSEARTCVANFVDLVQGETGRQWIGFTSMPWTPWFFDIAWDRTWIGLNTETNSMWLLCVTDTD